MEPIALFKHSFSHRATFFSREYKEFCYVVDFLEKNRGVTLTWCKKKNDVSKRETVLTTKHGNQVKLLKNKESDDR